MTPGTMETRGVSEFAGVAILVSITVLITASVGIAAMTDTTESTSDVPAANFSFQYLDTSSSMLITYDRGVPIDAGNITVRGGDGEATWDQLANKPENKSIEPGATVQISNRNDFGARVRANDRIDVVYTGDPINETILDSTKWA